LGDFFAPYVLYVSFSSSFSQTCDIVWVELPAWNLVDHSKGLS